MFGNKREVGTLCPLLGKECVKHDCTWYMQVRGQDPNTGKDVDHFGCAMAWVPTLLIENSQQQRHTSAAVESFRNEMVKANNLNLQLQAAGLQRLSDNG